MRELSNYITEKLDINKVNLFDKFPIDKPIKLIAKYLESNKFEKIVDNDDKFNSFDDFCEELNKMHYKAFIINTKNDWIRFADTSMEEVGERNPMFVIKDNGRYPRTFASETYTFYEKHLSEKDFLEVIKETFNF